MAKANFPPTRRGYEVREVVSALQKAIRRSDTNAALYWAYELDKSGFGNWCWKRLRVICSEDIGPAAPGLAADIRALHENWQDGRKAKGGEEILYLTHAVVALANAPKCRVVDWAVWHHSNDYVERLEIPDVAFDRHTLKGRRQGRNRQHFIDEASLLVQPEDRTGIADADERLHMMEDTLRDKAQRRINHEEHGIAIDDESVGLPLNPWSGPPLTEPPSNAPEGSDAPPSVHRLPGMS
jgi:hypothetical protein